MNHQYADTLLTLHNTKKDQIPQYPRQIIQLALEQLKDNITQLKQSRVLLQNTTNNISEDQMIFLKGKMVTKVDTIYRLKRFLLITHQTRCKKIQQQFWQFGGDIKKSELNNLSDKQKNYLLDYKNIINNYIEDIGLELTMDLTPPLQPIVEVKVIRDCGEIVEKGIILKKNLVFFINKKYVEKFIQRGDVVIIG